MFIYLFMFVINGLQNYSETKASHRSVNYHLLRDYTKHYTLVTSNFPEVKNLLW